MSTSHIEWQNLTMRMHMRQFTWLMNGFSRTLEGLKAAVALHFACYNFVRIHGALRVTPLPSLLSAMLKPSQQVQL